MPTSAGKNLIYRLALPFLAPAVPPHPVLLQDNRPVVMQKKLTRIIRRNHISGGAIAFRSGSEQAVLYTIPFHTETQPGNQIYYRVASITKMATALVAAVLIDRGILDPDRPVSALLPGSSDIPELQGICISELLSHTSGLTDPSGLENKLLLRVPLRAAVSGCRRPDKSFCYSNLGFGIIGCVFESLLGLPVEQIFQEYLFRPLNLDATLSGITLDINKIMPVKRILPWHENECIKVTKLGMIPMKEADPSLHYGYTAGSMYITLQSLIRLTECIRDKGMPLLSGRYSGYMKRKQASYGPISPTLSYGKGLLIIRDRRISGSVIYGHQGFAYGCVDGAFWEESTGNIVVSLNGGCSEARVGRLGIVNRDLCRFAFREEIPSWK